MACEHVSYTQKYVRVNGNTNPETNIKLPKVSGNIKSRNGSFQAGSLTGGVLYELLQNKIYNLSDS